MLPTLAALRTDRLTKYYGRVVGIEDLTLEVARGETFGLLGANGSGKTTTIRLILDLLRPTTGRAFVEGLDCQQESVRVRERIGYLPAEMPVYPEMTGGAYLRFLGRLQRVPPVAAWVTSLHHRFDLSDIDLARPIRDLSHGMKRKLGIVQALMSNAPLLVLDEPTSGLDPLMIEAFAETIADLRRDGRTVVLSSHVLSEVEKLCDRIALISRGRLARLASIREIRDGMPRRLTVSLSRDVESMPPLPGARVVSGSGRDWRFDLVGPAGPALQVLCTLPVADVEVTSGTLEDYVLTLYSDGHA
jgi:ABC-type multidrug transport system ATPase subunit